MGYTNYSMQVENETDEIWSRLLERFGFSDDGEMGDSIKWYDHETEMLQFSREFPDAIFHLRGEGEEPGDIWEKDFKAGQIQIRRAQIVIPPYDPTWQVATATNEEGQ